MMDDVDPWRFEQEGTQEWFCAKTRAPILPKPLLWRTRIKGYSDGNYQDDYLVVEIIRPRKYWWPKVVVRKSERIHSDTDWRMSIANLAEHCYDAWDLERSKEVARQGDNPYIGTFERG